MRPLVRAEAISKSYGPTTVFQDAGFHIFEKDKIALVGPNGAGKTTLFKLLAGQLRADLGEFETSDRLRIAYLPQVPEAPATMAVTDILAAPTEQAQALQDEVRELEAWMGTPGAFDEPDAQAKMDRYSELQSRLAEESAKGQISGRTPLMDILDVPDAVLENQWGNLSGGERSKVMLCKVLAMARETDLLLLDEPTNHMDIPTVEFIEDYLMDLDSAVVVAAHDRYLLDNVANRVFELGHKRVAAYDGNFSAYLEQKQAIARAIEARRRRERKEFLRQKQIIEELKRRNKYDAQVQSRQKRIQREYTEMPRITKRVNKGFELLFETGRVPHRVLTMERVSKRFGDHLLFDDVTLEIEGGDKIGLIGPNGCGKSTFMKLITGEVAPDTGTVKLSQAASVGYFGQHHETLSSQRTLIDEVRTLREPAPPDEWTRGLLGRFRFSGDSVFKKVSELSGGERARLSLAKFVADKHNFLLLDEPTNHLDLEGQEIVADALADYEGTVLVVSHNRSFLDAICDRIAVIDHGRIGVFRGTFSQARSSREMERFVGAEVHARYRVLHAFKDTQADRRYQKGDVIELKGLETQDFRRLIRRAEADGALQRVE